LGDLVKNERSGLIRLLHNKDANLATLKPFERDIFLLDTYVAGTGYVEGIEDLEPYLHIDDKLDFFREPDNPYDSKAIVVKVAGGVKIGYVPKADNAIFSRLMDAGKLLFARIVPKERSGKWLEIAIKVYLRG